MVEKTTENVDWMEQCELWVLMINFLELSPVIFHSGIPDKGNKAEITLTVLHRNFLGVDEFLGRVSLPLSGFDHQDKPRSK